MAFCTVNYESLCSFLVTEKSAMVETLTTQLHSRQLERERRETAGRNDISPTTRKLVW